METENFRRGSSNLPKTLWTLYVPTKFRHQEIRWNYGILRSVVQISDKDSRIFVKSLKIVNSVAFNTKFNSKWCWSDAVKEHFQITQVHAWWLIIILLITLSDSVLSHPLLMVWYHRINKYFLLFKRLVCQWNKRIDTHVASHGLSQIDCSGEF